jgi:hypothetical protein
MSRFPRITETEMEMIPDHEKPNRRQPLKRMVRIEISGSQTTSARASSDMNAPIKHKKNYSKCDLKIEKENTNEHQL